MILLFSLFLPIILIYLLHKIRKTNLPPGPQPLPLIGNLHHMATAREMHIYLWKLSKKYGPIIHMKLGSIPLIVISSPKLAKEVLKDQDLAFCSRPKSYGIQKLSYNHSDIIFSPYDDSWRELRKMTTVHLLSINKVQSSRSIREDEVSRMITKISNLAASHQVLNLNETAMAFSSSLICRIAFGKKYESETRLFDELLKEFLGITLLFFVSDFFPRFGWVDQVTGLRRKVDTTFKKLDSFYDSLIDEHLDRTRAKATDMEEDILDILIHLKHHHHQQNSSSLQLTDSHIKALLMNIFAAGTETSGSSIVWTMLALMKAPNLMKKLQTEIRNLVGEKGKVDEDDVPKLPYLKAVVSESLRLYPPAPLLVPRETMKRCNLDGYEIQPKTVVYVNAWAVGRDPEYWENPEEFVPERFLNNAIDIRGQDFAVIPFGSGRRICPGMSMGLYTVELAVANLVYSFEWELPNGVRIEDLDTETLPGLALHKKNPLLLLPKKYEF